MNTLGQHLDQAEQQLRHVADRLAADHALSEARAQALLTETRRTVLALHDLLTTAWGAASASLTHAPEARPGTDRGALVELARALDRRAVPPLTADAADYRDTAVVAAARGNVQHAEAIIRSHRGTDDTAGSPDAVRLDAPGGRWTVSERVAAVAGAAAHVETRVYELWREPRYTPAHIERSHELRRAAQQVLGTPRSTHRHVLELHEGGHRSLTRDALSDVEGPLERLCQQVYGRVAAGDLDGVSVRTIATAGVLVTGHLEVIARSAQHRAPELWTGVLGEIREQQLRRVAAEAVTARQAWQTVQAELRPLQPVGRPDIELTQQATQVRAALEAVTRRGDQWRPIEDLVRSRRDAEELMNGTARIAPDVEMLASRLDSGLSTARSADLCIRADQIPDPQAHVEERLRRRWVPAPPALLDAVRTAARGAEAATRTMAVSAAETRLSIRHRSPEPIRRLAAQSVATAPWRTDTDQPVRQQAPRQL